MKQLLVALCVAACGAQSPVVVPRPLPSAAPSEDESDPRTWVKRLDDSAQRATAIQRLSQLYEDAASKSQGSSVLDVIVRPLTNTYIGGGLDEGTRKGLIKELAIMGDGRASDAFAKALREYEHPRLDEDVKWAAEGVLRIAKTGAKLDPAVIDALWTGFTKYRPSVTNSIQGTQNLHDAILAVKDASYGAKAVALLHAPIEDAPSEPGVRRVNDQLEFWQMTAIQLIKELRYAPAAKELVAVLMARKHLGLARVAKAAILQMPREAVPLLASGLTGSDPDLKALQADWPDKGYVANLLDVLGYTSLDAARDAILAYLPQLDNDTNRAAAAQMLVWFGRTPATVTAFESLYERLPPIVEAKDGNDTGTERAQLLGLVGRFFDPALGRWALSRAANAKGMNMVAAKTGAIQSALQVMLPADRAAVERALTNLENSGLTVAEKRLVADDVRVVVKSASQAVDQCKADAGCYVRILEEPIPQTPNGNWKAIKAAYTAGVLGSDQTRKDLIAHLPQVKNPGVRLAMANAINHLAPRGDTADADALEKIVADDNARKDDDALRGDDALSKVALMLRARATP